MRFVEETGAAWTAEQLRAAEEELEAQKREWEANRLAALQKEEEMLKQEMIADEILTYSRKDANNQVNRKQEYLNRNRKKFIKSRKLSKQKLNVKQRSKITASTKSRSAIRMSSRSKVIPNKKSLSNKNRISKNGLDGGVNNKNKSGSNNKKFFAKQETTTETTKPTRKTTRTSIAAGSESSVLTKESLIRRSMSSDKKKFNSAMSDAAPRNGTGVKNQKLLSISKKRKQLAKKAKQQSEKKLKLSDVSNKKRQTLRRRSTITDVVCVRPLRSSPKKPVQKDDDEIEIEEKIFLTDEESSITADDDADNNEVDEDEDEEQQNDDGCGKESVEENETNSECERIRTKSQSCKIKNLRHNKVSHVEDDYNEQTNSNSIDVWDAHAQIQDTMTTNSTYYNVSEESDSDDLDSLAHLSVPQRKNTSSATSARCHRSVTPGNITMTPQQNLIDVNSPRTRSRGSVKINLWTLDVSPVLPGVKPHGNSKKETSKTETDKRKKVAQRSNDSINSTAGEISKVSTADEESEKQIIKENKLQAKTTNPFSSTPLRPPPTNSKKAKAPLPPRRGFKRLSSIASVSGTAGDNASGQATSKSNTHTLHRWLLKAPKVVQPEETAASAGSENSDSESPNSKSRVMNNGPS